uniref:DUF2846 domain-containing protein n=1 Tax=Parastrongyloides trichosuri TaxID=131310 RepID=A0A0N4ZTC6_PARTI
MFSKTLIFLIFIISLAVFSEGSLLYASAAVGETFKQDFGKETKSLRITRGDVEEILSAGKDGKYPNVKFSIDGVLTISPVTENDFGMYASTKEEKKKVEGGMIAVAPMTLQLVKKE